jgi:glycosyltransferase involved in cell wall biosynthesis
MAAGLPLLLVSDAGGHAELLAEGERGVAVPAGEPDALADALAQVLEDPAGARRMGVNARAFVARELTLARMVAGYEALYRQA